MNSFLHGKKTLTAPPLIPLASPPAAVKAAVVSAKPAGRPAGSAAAQAHAADQPGPVVDVIKEGDKIVRLVVTCSCGERVEIECLYPAG